MMTLQFVAATESGLRGRDDSKIHEEYNANNIESEGQGDDDGTHRRLANFAAVQSSLHPHEELAFELITRSNDISSLVSGPDNAGTFQLLRGDTLGSRVERMMIYVDERFQSEEFIGAIGLEFTDGSSAFAGSLGPNVRVETIQLGRLQGTFAVRPRPGNASYRVSSIVANEMGISVATQESEFRKSTSTREYDVDGRFLTGLVVSSEYGFTTLQFVVSKKIERSELIDITYNLSELDSPAEAKTLDTITLTNEGSEMQSMSAEYTSIKETAVTFSSESSYSFSNSFEVSTEFDAPIPGLPSVEVSLGFEQSSTISSGVANSKTKVESVTKSTTIQVPPRTSTRLSVTQFQEQVRDIPFSAKHKLTFNDGSSAIMDTVDGTMEGVIVSSVLISISETVLL